MLIVVKVSFNYTNIAYTLNGNNPHLQIYENHLQKIESLKCLILITLQQTNNQVE